VLNQVQLHEKLWESGGVAPRIINLGTRRRMARFTTRSLHPGGKSPRYTRVEILGSPRACVDAVVERKFTVLAGNGSQVIQPIICSQSWLSCPGSPLDPFKLKVKVKKFVTGMNARKVTDKKDVSACLAVSLGMSGSYR